jgi:hypothetical protein
MDMSVLRPNRKAMIPWMIYAWLAILAFGWIVTVIANRSAMSHLSHVSGAWVALSHWTTEGVYYPPLASDGYYAGTRFGPLAIALQAGAHVMTGDPVVGPKLLHAGYMVALITGIWFALAPLRLTAPVRLLLAFVPLATSIGWSAGLTIRHDALAAALQVWVIAILGRHTKPSWTVVGIAAVLGAAALLAKVSGVWGATAGLVYLTAVSPKRLLLYVPCGLVSAGIGLALVEWFSAGRFSENMATCMFLNDGVVGGITLQVVLDTTANFLSMIRHEALILLSLPLALIGVFYLRKHTIHLVASCLLVWMMTLYLLTRSGVFTNHLIDLYAVNAIGIGLFLSMFKLGVQESPSPSRPVLSSIACVVLLITSMTSFLTPPPYYGYKFYRAHEVKAAILHIAGIRPIPSAESLVREQLDPSEHIVSENPLVPVLLGQNPIVTDPFMMRVYFSKNPEAEREFIERINAREFDACVFVHYVKPELDVSPDHFGLPVIDAFRENYQFEESSRAASVFRPRRPGDKKE